MLPFTCKPVLLRHSDDFEQSRILFAGHLPALRV